jgi:hypothetical protein
VPRPERRERRKAIRSLRAQSTGAGTRAEILLLCPGDAPRLEVRSNRSWSRVLSRLLAPSLDRRIADGHSPESSLLLAARAGTLVSPAKRRTLAFDWADLLTRAQAPRGPRDPRPPVNRESILANESEIRRLIDMLVSPTPGRVRGIAMLSSLMSDGAGPLYNPHCSDALRGALLETVALLDPSAL